MNDVSLSPTPVGAAPVPDHVDPSLVIDFDFRNPAGMDDGDIYAAYARLHDGPDIPWTVRNGGHWIATRAEDIKWVQETHELFSNREKSVPPGQMPPMPPITFDPPDHSRYRAVLNPYFAKGFIERNYAEKSRDVIAGLIEGLKPRGECEFVSEFSVVAPLMIFWDFVNLPYDEREQFLTWGRHAAGYGTHEERIAAFGAVQNYLGELLDRRLDDSGEDVFTGISQWRNNPRYKDRWEIVGMAELVFFGGQDTVASQMGFAMLRLAERPELQQRLKDDPEVIQAAVEELLRRHGLSCTGRLVRQDVSRKGATMKAGDMIMTMNPLSGLDSRAYPDPFTVDFDRGMVPHNSLGNGPHKCVGQHLARMELRVMLEEWSRRMPIVRIARDKPAPSSHPGPVIGMDHLYLAWDI
jgi:cytochrome P450